MLRRSFAIAVLGGLVAPPLYAQPARKSARIGFLSLRPVNADNSDYHALFAGLRERGWETGKNLAVEWRSAESDPERLPALAQELVRIKVDVIVAAGTQATSAAQAATKTIPIVMGSTGDPLGSGFVKSLARPGGNITGLSNLSAETGPKQLEILRSLVPGLSVTGVLANPTNSSHGPIVQGVQEAGRVAGIRIVVIEADSPRAIDEAFPTLARHKARGLIVATDAFFNTHGVRIAELALKHRLASMFTRRANVKAGGLVSYGQNIDENYRRAAVYVDKILHGANPGDLPVEQSTQFDLVFNRRTAKALGITIPPNVLMQATEVIN